jgi:hypothetical protein
MSASQDLGGGDARTPRGDDRRAHPRVDASFSVHLSRLGTGSRPQPADVVRVVDLSLGGVRVVAPSWANVGDVVHIMVDELGLRGLVVGVSPTGSDRGWRNAHIAFTNMSDPTLEAVSQIVELHTVPRAERSAVGAR